MRPREWGLAAMLVGATLTGCGGSAEAEPVDGADLYLRSCATCHGVGGSGGIGAPLIGVADRLTRDEHLAVVRDGRVGSIGQMPGFGGRFSEEEIVAVVDHERTFTG